MYREGSFRAVCAYRLKLGNLVVAASRIKDDQMTRNQHESPTDASRTPIGSTAVRALAALLAIVLLAGSSAWAQAPSQPKRYKIVGPNWRRVEVPAEAVKTKPQVVQASAEVFDDVEMLAEEGPGISPDDIHPIPDPGYGAAGMEGPGAAWLGPGMADGCNDCGRVGPGCAGWSDPPDGGYPYQCLPFWQRLKRQLYVRGEYLMLWSRGYDVPALVTTSPQTADFEDAGVLGVDGTEILFGDSTINDGMRSGGRITLGYWLRPCGDTALEAIWFRGGREVTDYHADSTGDPILARPFFNVEPGFEGQDAIAIAYPGLLEGSIDVHAVHDFNGVEVLARHRAFKDCWARLDFVIGWRYARVADDLTISHSLLSIDPSSGIPVDTTIDVVDRFETQNEFNGAEIGVIADVRHNCWTFEFLMKLAMGNMHSRVFVDGSTDTISSTGTTFTRAGLLTQSSNIGVYDSDQFSVMPELGLNLAYDLTPRLRLTFGYTFLYLSSVARPGDQIDPDVNLSQLPSVPFNGVARPEYLFTTTDFWARGMNFGFEYRF